jgi:fucose permease
MSYIKIVTHEAKEVYKVAALPMGSLLDRVGPKTASITGGALFATGCIIFSLGIVRDGRSYSSIQRMLTD